MVFQKYQSTPASLANYNFNDIADATGNIPFYGGEISISGSNVWALSGEVFYSTSIISNIYMGTSGTTEPTVMFDHDYDVKVNLPRTVNGKVLINITAGMKSNELATFYTYFKIYFRKWDGTTETELGNVETETLWISNATTQSDKTFATWIDIVNQQFKVGETIRVTVNQIIWCLAQKNGYVGYGHDPADRDDPNGYIAAGHPTALKIWIPFKIEA